MNNLREIEVDVGVPAEVDDEERWEPDYVNLLTVSSGLATLGTGEHVYSLGEGCWR